jgi:hypothetical protein
MPTKQSNKQTQNVKVTVNNHISSKCCDEDKKKKRKPRKQQPPPSPPDEMDDFPVLNTPARNPAVSGISALPVRNTVYMPSTVQISTEGAQPPIPAYFDRPYTNLVRTIEDMRNSLMSEIQDVRGLIATPEMMAQETQTQPQGVAMETQTQPQGVTVGTDTMPRQMTMSDPQSLFNMSPVQPNLNMSDPQSLFNISPALSPVKQKINDFEAMMIQNDLFNEEETPPIPMASTLTTETGASSSLMPTQSPPKVKSSLETQLRNAPIQNLHNLYYETLRGMGLDTGGRRMNVEERNREKLIKQYINLINSPKPKTE